MINVGLIGGVSPEATKIYYDLLNAHARRRKGGQHSARILFSMLDYGVMYSLYQKQDWDSFTDEVVRAAHQLKAAGASAIAITSGTTHVAAEAVAKQTDLPVIHMLDCLSEAMQAKNVTRPLLLGTPWVMSGSFFRSELLKRYAGDPISPTESDQNKVGEIIFTELVNGIVDADSKAAMINLVNAYDADGVILGCTELCMILQDGDCTMPVFSTTHIHADAIDSYIHQERKHDEHEP